MAKHSIEDLDISMERGEQVNDGFKYLILAEFKERQRQQNAVLSASAQSLGKAVVQEAQTPAAVAKPSGILQERLAGKISGRGNGVCKALAESKGTDWLLALIAFLLFCILISK